ncbi:MAG: glutaredoxin [Clostridia bacterium]|nr:glutaredoxin [Clostridia bacterium]
MIKVYGSGYCPDTQAALKKLDEIKAEYEFIDATGSVEGLKAFVELRENTPEIYDAVRARGGVGIPCFVTSCGQKSLDLAEVL